MRYEFTMDEIKVPFRLTGLKSASVEMAADIQVGVEVSADGEAHSPDIRHDGKYQRVTGWLAEAILEAANLPFHEERINAIIARRVPAFDQVSAYGTQNAGAL